jgi:glucokinase
MATAGIDLGGTKILGVVLEEDGTVLGEEKVPTPSGLEALLEGVSSVFVNLAARHSNVNQIGLGAPGLVDRSGVLRFAPNLPGVVDAPLRQRLEQLHPGTTWYIGNDATCAGIGEQAHGAAQGCSEVVLVTLGTGIGGGIITSGRALVGANGFAGEIGHVVVDPHGPPCPCGKRGCWERFASGSGLGRLAREAALAGQAVRVVELAGGDPENVRGEHVTTAAAEGDAQAIEVMTQYAWWLALGLSNLANIFDPELFVLGGGLIEAGDVLLLPTRRALAELVEAAEHRPTIRIVPAKLGERAGAIGAAVMAAHPVICAFPSEPDH